MTTFCCSGGTFQLSGIEGKIAVPCFKVLTEYPLVDKDEYPREVDGKRMIHQVEWN